MKIDGEFKCICGGKPLEKWIACDNSDCIIQWYHLECLGLKRAPAGKWLCPRCRPNATTTVSDTSHQRAAVVPSFPNLGGNRILKEEDLTSVRGLASKKRKVAEPKPRWKGWIELSAEEEDAMRHKVEDPWIESSLPKRSRKQVEKSAEDDLPQKTRARELRSTHIDYGDSYGDPHNEVTVHKLQSKVEPAEPATLDNQDEAGSTKGIGQGSGGDGMDIDDSDEEETDLSLYGGFVTRCS